MDSVSCGSPKELSEIQTIQARIHDFTNLPQKRGEAFKTSILKAHGYEWVIRIYPCGHRLSSESFDQIGVFIQCVNVREKQIPSVTAKFAVQFGSKVSFSFGGFTTFTYGHAVRGFPNTAPRGRVLKDCLEDDGSLIVDINLQVYAESKKSSTWYPKSVQNNSKVLKRLLENSKHSDVCFAIVNDDGETTKFHGHKNILSYGCPMLYDLIANTSSKMDAIEIQNITGPIFKLLLKHIYTGLYPEMNDATTAKDCLLAADRFGLIHLKLWIESEITAKFVTTPNVVADWLCLADGHSCPLLKEKCMNMCSEDLRTIKATDGWKHVKESSDLLMELLDFCAGGGSSRRRHHQIRHSNTTYTNDSIDDDDFDNMDIRTLRERLEVAELDLDGTRDMLIQRLKEHRDFSGFELSDTSVSQDENEGEEDEEQE